MTIEDDLEDLIEKAAKIMSPFIFEGLEQYAESPTGAPYIYYLTQAQLLRKYARKLVEADWRPS